MDDLALLKDMADTTPLPDRAALAPARAQLMATISQAPTDSNWNPTAPAVNEIRSAGGPAAVNGARRAGGSAVDGATLAAAGESTVVPMKNRRRRRLFISGIVVAGMAAAITAVVALGALEPVGVAPAKASAAEILHQAADAARAQPATPPRPDQFVYTKSQSNDGSFREAWLSADGTKDGMVKQQGNTMLIPGCVGGQRPVRDKYDKPIGNKTEACEPTPAYRTDLPTDAEAMRQYLTALPSGDDKVNSLGKNIAGLVSEDYVPPASLAALFEAVAGLDGLKIVPNATDSAGRPGVGVSWTSQNSTMTLVFDEQTHVFLGFAGLGGAGGAVIQQAVVDTAGQQP